MRAVILVSLVCVLGYASAEVCQCTSFFESHIDETKKIHTAPNVELPSCDEENATKCKTQCEALFNKVTNNGNLQHRTSKGTTVAEFSCDKYKEDVHDGQLGCYYKMCDHPWTLIKHTNGKTCCKAGHEVAC